MIQALYALSVDEKDYPAQVMLPGFVSEQVEEESNFEQVVANLRIAGEGAWHLLALDNQIREGRIVPQGEARDITMALAHEGLT